MGESILSGRRKLCWMEDMSNIVSLTTKGNPVKIPEPVTLDILWQHTGALGNTGRRSRKSFLFFLTRSEWCVEAGELAKRMSVRKGSVICTLSRAGVLQTMKIQGR